MASARIQTTLKAPKFGRLIGSKESPVTLTQSIPGGGSSRAFYVNITPIAGTAAYRQGALAVSLTRAAGDADTTWDGNPDTAVNISATTSATGNASAEGSIRGLQCAARNRGTNINWVLGANISARNDSGKQASRLAGIELRIENYGNVADEIVGINVNLSDENSNVDPHTKYGIRVRNTDASGMGAVDAALHVSHSSTNGFAAFAHLATNAGDGAVASTTTPTGAATEALIVKIGSNLRYIPCYAAVGFGG